MSKRINVLANGRAVLAREGSILADALNIERPCGGHGSCGKCRVKINGREELACKYVITEDISVEFGEGQAIVSETGAVDSGVLTDHLCLALDIGTTTLALALVSLDSGTTVKTVTAVNPQRRFGADVMSRIEYCMKNSVSELQRVLVTEINKMIERLSAPRVETMYVAANATMLHTLFGVDCSSIGVAPYSPAFLGEKRVPAEEIGIMGAKEIVSLPSVSAFVGADIVAGLELVGKPESGRYSMLIDLGTNAEIVLYSAEGGVATAAAAGPCFEGANISCGMSAMNGAVSEFSLSGGKSMYKTVGGEVAKGICGTGLVDLVAELLRNGIIDETGYMEEDFEVATGVVLTRDDVRQYQLAKSAIYSAILSLMRIADVGYEDISVMYVSGGFSSKINVDNASYSGLFPQELAEKAVTLNNSSLQGLVKHACHGGKVESTAESIRYIDLSSNNDFARLFMENMMFFC